MRHVTVLIDPHIIFVHFDGSGDVRFVTIILFVDGCYRRSLTFSLTVDMAMLCNAIRSVFE